MSIQPALEDAPRMQSGLRAVAALADGDDGADEALLEHVVTIADGHAAAGEHGAQQAALREDHLGLDRDR
ncbi:hypothetical protein [Sorangium sp. So ce1000]|uniref:hypothetical protein n=1 Tax=Sorangium sp. So ce1000 TaxID=3133325 RepID=UPI003F6213E1